MIAEGQRVFINFNEDCTEGKNKTERAQGILVGHTLCADSYPDESVVHHSVLAIVKLAKAFQGYLENDYFKTYLTNIVVAPQFLEEIPLYRPKLDYALTLKVMMILSSRLPVQKSLELYHDDIVTLSVVPYGPDNCGAFVVTIVEDGQYVDSVPTHDIFGMFYFKNLSVRFTGTFD